MAKFEVGQEVKIAGVFDIKTIDKVREVEGGAAVYEHEDSHRLFAESQLTAYEKPVVSAEGVFKVAGTDGYVKLMSFVGNTRLVACDTNGEKLYRGNILEIREEGIVLFSAVTSKVCMDTTGSGYVKTRKG